jgi:hypothetical protein
VLALNNDGTDVSSFPGSSEWFIQDIILDRLVWNAQ